MKEEIREKLLAAGAVAAGFAEAGEIDPHVHEQYAKWIGEGWHGEMAYLERHIPLRRHTDNVLPGAKTVISLAFSYAPQEWRAEELPAVAAYAYGEDYHIVLRERLSPIVREFQKEWGGKWRICIDSAPVAERYWALKSGIGKKGLNGSIIIENCGGLCFLVEILTTIIFPPDYPSNETCIQCGKCRIVCPGKAIKDDGTIDARRCINYLTIEKKGEFSESEKSLLSHGSGHLFGCDLCFRSCPHNHLPSQHTSSHSKSDKKSHSLFPPLADIACLTPDKILRMTFSSFQTTFSRSPLSYSGLPLLIRNAKALKK